MRMLPLDHTLLETALGHWRADDKAALGRTVDVRVAMTIEDGLAASCHDRRKRKRVSLRWPVKVLRRSGIQWIEGQTENLTSEGLYCVSSEPFQLGERLQCIIIIPVGSFGNSKSPVVLKCGVTVTRVEAIPSGFGLGCHIDNYVLINSQWFERTVPSLPVAG